MTCAACNGPLPKSHGKRERKYCSRACYAQGIRRQFPEIPDYPVNYRNLHTCLDCEIQVHLEVWGVDVVTCCDCKRYSTEMRCLTRADAEGAMASLLPRSRQAA